MTVRVERTAELAAPRERVWEFISDPEKRAGAISVVRDFEVHDDKGMKATWHVKIPIPFVNRTISVETEDIERRPPEYVKFTGKSAVMNVTGEHDLQETGEGTTLVNTFVVDGRVPGVERFFKSNLDDELKNLEAAIREDLDL